MTEINFDEWKGKNAINSKAVLGKQLTFYGLKDYHKPRVSKKDPTKTYMATYHIIFAVDKATGEKIKIFGSDNLAKILNMLSNKYPFDDTIVFVEGKGKYGHGYYKLKVSKTPYPNQQQTANNNTSTTQK